VGRKSRTKGKSGELEVVHLAREYGFPEAKRGAPMQAGYSDSQFADVIDVGFSFIESKRYKRVPVNKFAREVLIPERPGFVNVLAWRDDGGPWFASVRLEDWLKVTRELLNLRARVAHLSNIVDPPFALPQREGK
jgi:hypothetical protein